MAEKATFSSKIGLIAATVGSAIGLGNVWRFPSEVQSNGGAAFLLVYLICLVVLGIPVMLAEFSLGRAGRSDSVGAFRILTPGKKWWIVGAIGLLASYFILSYYMVVAGWTIEYMWQSITGELYHGYVANSGNSFFAGKMGEMIATSTSPIVWTYIMIALNLVVLLMGVKKGIEKVSNILMPLLFVLLIVFCYTSLSLPNAAEGVKFFLYPDFSKINSEVIVRALGQAFFTLSLGMGILVTYAAYFPANTKLTSTATSVAGLDFLVAFLMGLIIFPAATSFGLNDASQVQGTTLVFVTLPEIFASMQGSQVWSILFFLLLGVAAITSTISIAEVSVAFVHSRCKVSRTAACFIVLVPVFATSAICSLSLGAMPSLSIGGMAVFDFLDALTTRLMLPVSALLICIYVGWILPKDFIEKELTNYGEFHSKAAPFVKFLVKYVCPVLISVVLIYSLIG